MLVFDGKVETMRHDVRNMSLEYLAEVIRSDVRKNTSRSVPSAYHNTAEDPEWNEAEDETDSRPQEDVIPSCSDVYTTAVFEPMLTPPDTPPASLHVGGSTSVEPSQTRQSTSAAPAPWQCAFLAGQFGNAVANVEGRLIDRAEFRRQLLGKQRSETQNATTLTREQGNERLKTKTPIHRHELEPAPRYHGQVLRYSMMDGFLEAERTQSHEYMKTWTEVPGNEVGRQGNSRLHVGVHL